MALRGARRAAGALRRGRRPVRFGSFASPRPLSAGWGYDRGTPVDRWYIEDFLERHRDDVTGRVLEVKDSGYTRRFGRGVTQAAVLDVDPDNPSATVVADLGRPGSLPEAAFECLVVTQTLQYVLDVPAALANAHRALAPGGVLLATVPAVSPVTAPPLTDYWRFTAGAMARLLEDSFGPGAATVQARGNVLATIAFLEGLAAEDLAADELSHDDPRLPLVVCARAVRGA